MQNFIESFDNSELLALTKEDLKHERLDSALAKLKIIYQRTEDVSEATSLLARLYARLNLYDRSIELLEKYCEKFPKDRNELFQLGLCQLEAGITEKAKQIFDTVLESDPFYPPALFYSAVCLVESNETDTAKEKLDKLIRNVNEQNLYFDRAKDLLAKINRTNSNLSDNSDTINTKNINYYS